MFFGIQRSRMDRRSCFFWILVFVFLQVVYADVCVSQQGMTTVTLTCASGWSCCEDNTDCCEDSELSTTVIVAFAIGGAVILITVVIVIIYAIVKHKKKSHVTQVSPRNAAELDDLPPYTPRVLVNHPAPAPPPRYEDIATGSAPSTRHPTTQAEKKYHCSRKDFTLSYLLCLWNL